MSKLDEQALRKPEFSEEHAEWVTLADGQDWCIPHPYRVFEVSDDGMKMVRRLYVRDDQEYPDPMAKITDDSTEDEIMGHQLEAIRHLLTLNYDLKPADFKQLIRLGGYNGHTPPEIAELTEALRDICYGRARPKSPGAATSDAP